MIRLRLLLVALLAVAGWAPASADQILQLPRIDNSGNLNLPGGPKLGTYQGGVYTATPDKLTIQGSGSTGDVSGMTATTRSPTDSTTSLATTAFVQAVKGVRAFAPGTGATPYVEDPVVRSATTLSGSPTFTVSSSSGLRVGMSLWTIAAFPYGTRVTAIAGTTITAAAPATSSGTVSMQFGQNRWDQTSNLLANTGGFSKLHVGQAATSGNSLDWFSGGYEVPGVYSALVTNGDGRTALVTAVRTSDNTVPYASSYGATIGVASYLRNDATRNPGYTAWNYYLDTRVPAGTFPLQTLGMENSLENLGSEVVVDPYTYNQTAMTANLRLNSGVGERTANAVSTAIDIGPNGAQYLTGLNIVANDGTATPTNAIKVKPGRTYREAIAMGPNHALVWYRGQNLPAWNFTSTATTANNNAFLLGDANVQILGADLMVGGANNSVNVDRAIAVNGAATSALGTQVGNAQAASIPSAATYSGLFDSRTVDFYLGTAGAINLTVRANKAVRFPPLASLPASPVEGDCGWDGVAHKLKCFDGTTWQAAW